MHPFLVSLVTIDSCRATSPGSHRSGTNCPQNKYNEYKELEMTKMFRNTSPLEFWLDPLDVPVRSQACKAQSTLFFNWNLVHYRIYARYSIVGLYVQPKANYCSRVVRKCSKVSLWQIRRIIGVAQVPPQVSQPSLCTELQCVYANNNIFYRPNTQQR